jgi:hypothetical protein
MSEPQNYEPEEYEPRRYERQRNEKDEKGQDEKGRDESWDEKWRRDPVEAAVWAFALIWFGLVWLLSNTGFWYGLLGEKADWWAVGFIGAGVILLLGVFVRLLRPAYRRPITGSLILGIVFIGIGLGQIWDWVIIGPLVLLGIGIGLLVTGVFRRRE